MGGQRAVPDSVVKQIRNSSGSTVSRISGATRYETSITFAQWASEQGCLHMNNVVFATGANFPDALAAGPFAGRNSAVLLLADPNGSTASFVKQYVKQHGDVDNAISSAEKMPSLAILRTVLLTLWICCVHKTEKL